VAGGVPAKEVGSTGPNTFVEQATPADAGLGGAASSYSPGCGRDLVDEALASDLQTETSGE
jgi:hypothetical protein